MAVKIHSLMYSINVSSAMKSIGCWETIEHHDGNFSEDGNHNKSGHAKNTAYSKSIWISVFDTSLNS